MTTINPFTGLICAPIARLPITGSSTRHIEGKRVDERTNAMRSNAKKASIPADELADVLEARRQRDLAYYRARYEAQKNTPEFKAKRKAYYEATKAAALKRAKKWRKANRARARELNLAYRLRNLEARRKAQQEASRKYYAAHRDEILAKRRAATQSAKKEAQP